MGNHLAYCVEDGAASARGNGHAGMTSEGDKQQEWKPTWQAHLARLQRSVAKLVAEGSERTENARVFHALLQLYAHKDVISNLHALCETENGLRNMTFYVPQLATFFMKGGFEHREKLQQLFLHISARDPRFAHRLTWFLLAFCTYEESNASQRPLMEAIEVNGGISVEKLANLLREKIRSPDPKAVVVEDVGIVDTFKSGETRSPSNSDASSPTPHSLPTPPPSLSDGVSPPPLAGGLSDTLSPIHIMPRRASLHSPSHFRELINFTEGLTKLSDSLRLIPGYERNAQLKGGLADLASDFLPSNYLYLPLQVTFRGSGDANDADSGTKNFWNIVGLHGHESIVFSTKERCPYLCTLEIVDASHGDDDADVEHVRNEKIAKERETETDAMQRISNWWDKRKRDFEEFTREFDAKMAKSRGGVAKNEEGGMQMTKTVSDQEVKRTKDKDLATTIPEPLQRPSRSSSAPSMDRDSASRTSFNDMGQWETFNIAEKDQNTGKKINEEGSFSGFADCLIDDAMMFPGEARAMNTNAPSGRPKSGNNQEPDEGDDSEDFTPVKRMAGAPPGLERQGSAAMSETETDNDLDESYEEPEPLLFSESWHDKEARIREQSSFGHLPGWRLVPIIVKAYDDLRQEQMVAQIVKAMGNILKEANVPVYIRPYDIIATQLGGTGGLIEAVPDTVSIDSLKRHDPSFTTLDDFFVRHFGMGVRSSQGYRKARRNFVASMAGYAVICYLLQIKDRHNGNILLDNEGHIVHIDWGFVFMSSPGKNLNFEAAPFKLTSEFVALMGGSRSSSFRRFRRLTARAFLELRKRREEIILLVEMLSIGNEDLGCFRKRPQAAIAALRERFRPDLTNDNDASRYVDGLINQSLRNWTTKWYDEYQMCCLGIAA